MGIVVGLVLAHALGGVAEAATYPDGFEGQALPFAGLEVPTAVAFAPDGAAFVAEKRGIVKRFASIGDDSTGEVVIDLRGKVNEHVDRGLLGLALDPAFASTRRLFVLYTSEEALPGTRTLPDPTFGTWDDDCPEVPGGTDEGCVVAAKLSRVQLDAGGRGTETELIHDWCQQFPSHSIGTLAFGRDGQLYASAGDGASWTHADYGQSGGGDEVGDPPANPCGDAPGGVGVAQTQPTAEGGALRSQDLRTPGDPTGLSGAIIRVDPDTGAAAAGNPLNTGDPNRRRIIAHGFRNPFRFTPRPGTDELWVGDVGWGSWEEIDRVADVDDGVVENFGWPCFEGADVNWGYSGALDLDLCRTLGPAEVTRPWLAYGHASKLDDEPCAPDPGASIGPIAFAEGDGYPERYRGGLFFGDYARSCMWFVPAGPNGRLDPTAVEPFAADLGAPVDLKPGPGGDLYFADAYGAITRIRHVAGNAAPVARITTQAPYDRTVAADPPLTVDFDGRTSSDRDDAERDYAWDLDGDGAFDDSTLADPPARVYEASGTVRVGLRVSDPAGGTDTAFEVVRTDNTPPTPEIAVTAGSPFRVGETVRAGGSAVDAQDGAVPASALRWSVTQLHCVPTGGCHQHPQAGPSGVGSVAFATTDHPWRSYYRVTVTATDRDGLTGSTVVDVFPRRSELTLGATVDGTPVAGLMATIDGEQADAIATSPHVRSEGSAATLSVPREQTVGLDTYVFSRWSSGATDATHVTTVGAGRTTVNAELRQAPRNVAVPRTTGAAHEGQQLTADDGGWVGHPAPTRTRRWERCDISGGDCTAIPGATRPIYRATAADVGRRLRIVVRGENDVKVPAEAASVPTAAVAIGDAPTVSLAVTRGAQYAVGDTIAFSAAATDAEDGALPAAAVRWSVAARRCAPACADTAVAAESESTSGALLAGDRPWRTTHVITVTATDSAGRATTAIAEAEPLTGTLTAHARAGDAGVDGLRLDVDGDAAAAGAPVVRGRGATVRVAAPVRADAGTDRHVFRRWSDGPAVAARTVVLSEPTRQLTAEYDTAPRSLAAPVLDGAARDGEVLRLTRGAWVGNPAPNLVVSWERCRSGDCEIVPGVTGVEHRLGPDDVGRSVRARVVADNGVLEPASAVTAGSPQVAAAAPPPPELTPSPPAPLPRAPETPADRTPPALRLDGPLSARPSARVAIGVRCPSEPCAVSVLPRVRVSGGAPATLARLERRLSGGGRARVVVALGPRTLARVRTAVRAGRTVRLEIAVTARDPAGNAATRRWTVRLR